MKQHIVDFFWKNKTAFIVIRKGSESETEKRKLKGMEFNWELSDKRKCPGTFKLLEWKYEKCADSVDMTGTKFRRCKNCEAKIGFKNAFLYDGEPTNDDVRQYLNQLHFVYLAFFPPDKVKVGTASESRKIDRMYDQGAYFYTFIAKTFGMDIQQIERYISKKTSLVESVMLSHKFKFLGYKVNETKAKEILESKKNEVKKCLDGTEFEDLLIDEDKIFQIEQNSYNNIELKKEFSKLGGRVVDVVGRLIIIENYGNLFAVDGKKLPGTVVEKVDKDIEIETRKKQIGLL